MKCINYTRYISILTNHMQTFHQTVHGGLGSRATAVVLSSPFSRHGAYCTHPFKFGCKLYPNQKQFWQCSCQIDEIYIQHLARRSVLPFPCRWKPANRKARIFLHPTPPTRVYAYKTRPDFTLSRFGSYSLRVLVFVLGAREHCSPGTFTYPSRVR